MAIYENLANIFVASFIGNPSMNIIKGCIENGKFAVSENSYKVPAGYAKLEGELCLGVRSEYTRPVSPKEGILNKICAIEFLGESYILNAEIALGCIYI